MTPLEETNDVLQDLAEKAIDRTVYVSHGASASVAAGLTLEDIDQALESIQSIVDRSLGKDAPTHPKDYGLHATVERNLNARLQSIRKDWGIE